MKIPATARKIIPAIKRAYSLIKGVFHECRALMRILCFPGDQLCNNALRPDVYRRSKILFADEHGFHNSSLYCIQPKETGHAKAVCKDTLGMSRGQEMFNACTASCNGWVKLPLFYYDTPRRCMAQQRQKSSHS